MKFEDIIEGLKNINKREPLFNELEFLRIKEQAEKFANAVQIVRVTLSYFKPHNELAMTENHFFNTMEEGQKFLDDLQETWNHEDETDVLQMYDDCETTIEWVTKEQESK